jgi:undecaprenyl-diphosphatase
MYEMLILGAVQGIAEWLPVSSEGLLVLIQVNFFSLASIDAAIKSALFLHLGTFLAALIYFRQDVWRLFRTVFKFGQADSEVRQTIRFLLIATLLSGILGWFLLKLLVAVESDIITSSRVMTAIVALLLLITGLTQLASRRSGQRNISHLKSADSVLLGVVQGLAVLPGLSRSGLTVAALLLRKFDKVLALRLSFLLSLPIVLAGNILLNLPDFQFSPDKIVGLLSAFVFGLLTIHLFLKLAQKINFGLFVVLFGFLTFVAVFI